MLFGIFSTIIFISKKHPINFSFTNSIFAASIKLAKKLAELILISKKKFMRLYLLRRKVIYIFKDDCGMKFKI